MLPGFPVPIPWIMFLTAGPMFHAVFDCEHFKKFR